MALLKNLFPKGSFRRRNDKIILGTGEASISETSEREQQINEFCCRQERTLEKEHMRLVVIAESERRLLFDSETVLPAQAPGIPPTAPLSSCGRFKFLRHRSDVPAIAQMVLGSMSTVKCDSFKIHHLSSTKQLMVSRVISISKSAKSLSSESKVLLESVNSVDSESHYSTIRSLEGMRQRNHRRSQTIEPPEGFTRVRNASLQLDSEETVVMEPLRAFSPNRISRHRRLQLSQRGNLCDENNSGRWSSRSRLSSCSSTNDDDTKQIAIGVIFREDERQFILQHIPLIEIEMLKLEAQIVKASLSRTHFLHLLYQGWSRLVQAICVLHNSPRLRAPVWLSLMDDKLSTATANTFCATLANLIYRHDLKSTGYFLSSLLSSLLMNHLAWVASVASSDRCVDSHRSLLLGTRENVDILHHPYNTHLAQYMEISGSIGGAARLSRTVVMGDDMLLVTQLLYVLSYFVRCSVVHPNLHSAGKWSSQPQLKCFSPSSLQRLSEEVPTDNIDSHLDVRSPEAKSDDNGSSCDEPMDVEGDSMPTDDEPNDWHLPLEDSLRQRPFIDSSLARSLLAGPCDAYCSHFVLSGLRRSAVNFAETISSMIDHVKNGESELLYASSPDSSNSSTASDTASFSPTVIVLADTTTYTVKVISGDESNVEESTMVAPCEAVVAMLEQFGDLHRIGAAPSFLISFLEDALGDIVAKSFSLVEMLGATFGDRAIKKHDDKKVSPTISAERVAHVIGCDYSDLRLIANVAAVYFPPVLQLVV
uniref:UDENN FNIP1/2-type domain-containing protein n=1 Tax=Parascaris univalens TaxID=6257 RepID=A0A915C7G0_PARUN